jgi:hypothetical protein
MKSSNGENELLRNLLLLSIYKREENISINEIIAQLDESGAMDIKEGKSILKQLRNEKLFSDGELTPIGVVEAKKAEEFFRM